MVFHFSKSSVNLISLSKRLNLFNPKLLDMIDAEWLEYSLGLFLLDGSTTPFSSLLC